MNQLHIWIPPKPKVTHTHLKLFNGISPFTNDETHFAGWNQDILAGFVPVPASLHNLTEQPLRLPGIGHKQNQDHKGLNMRALTHTEKQGVFSIML